jgi:valyl-tRNA synthetase
MLDKTYRPDEVEAGIYEKWEESGAFKADPSSDAKPYTIMIPPPNVTGSLHMGHGLTFTIQDILIRYHRMKGFDALWQSGMDHAGIATQMVVERQLAEEGLTRHDLGREKFIERVWKWKAESGGAIQNQFRRLGASLDWSRERFTMDDGMSEAVLRVFVELHKAGLIYRDKRLVNWDPKLHTAISDLEVEPREQNGKMWYFKYPLEEDNQKFVVVGTTRPETMLGDTAVAVHPDDERYTDLIGKNVVLPLVGRLIPIVADEYADPEKGSGAVKITPAHDFNDFEVGRRNNLENINVLDGDAKINENAPKAYQGLDRFDARDKVVAEIESLGLLDKIEENPMTVPYGDRSGVVIEPWLMDQWFVDAEKLAVGAIEAVETGKTNFVPKNWEKTYYEWMRNIQPWCVSRQIWWGHQIPAWYGPDGEIFVEHDEAQALAAAEKHYGKATELTRDEDVLDTWFSSGLWPFSTLGWPEQTPELKRYYPTDVLVTGFDIIFFWVARMMMSGIQFMDDVPFKTIYIHALVRDEHGQKMSKSKGNIVDPLDVMEKYGTDALRFTLAAYAAPGRDVKLADSRIEGYRNFVTKLWNAARFAEINECKPVADFDPNACELTLNKWIVGKAAEAAKATSKAIDDYRFNDAAHVLYHFAWGTFCDWYVEFTKPALHGDNEGAKTETRAATAWVLDQIITMLHPIMPFVTEELWNGIAERPEMLIKSPWFDGEDITIDETAATEMDWVVKLITDIRSVRSEMNVPPGAKLALGHKDAGPATLDRLERHGALIKTLARITDFTAKDEIGKGEIQTVLDEATFILPVADVIDIDQEKARLTKEIEKLDKEIGGYDKKLSNQGFLAKAPADVVETQKERREDAAQAVAKLKEAAARLAQL